MALIVVLSTGTKYKCVVVKSKNSTLPAPKNTVDMILGQLHPVSALTILAISCIKAANKIGERMLP
jgi:hypothetical protein